MPPTPGRQRSRPCRPPSPGEKTVTLTQDKLDTIISRRVGRLKAANTQTVELAEVYRSALHEAVERINELEAQFGAEPMTTVAALAGRVGDSVAARLADPKETHA